MNINELNTSSSIDGGDFVPIWDATASSTRKASLKQISDYTLGNLVLPDGDSAIDALLNWQRKTADFIVSEQYASFDVFPTAANVNVTLPIPTQWAKSRIDIYNQTNNTNSVTVKNHLGVTIAVLQPVTAFSFYYDTEQSVSPWDSVKLDGTSVISLPVGTYGDFNNIAWNTIPSGKYIITGLGSQFTNLPTGSVLLPMSSYSYNVDHVNVTGDYYDTVFFTSTSDFTNNFLGRPCIRAGADFGSATSVGWRILGYKAEESFALDVQNQTSTAQALPTSATTFVWPIQASVFGDISYNTATGTVTINKTGVYTFTFMYNTVVPSGSHSVFSGAKIWNGTSFVPSRYSARVISVRTNESGQTVFSSTNRFAAGTQIQFDTWCDAGVNINSLTPVGGSALYTVPAARMLITGVESQ